MWQFITMLVNELGSLLFNNSTKNANEFLTLQYQLRYEKLFNLDPMFDWKNMKTSEPELDYCSKSPYYVEIDLQNRKDIAKLVQHFNLLQPGVLEMTLMNFIEVLASSIVPLTDIVNYFHQCTKW